ncbi:MAG: hypothetical protein CML68_23790 [Rhodobacteraceae bacterium]|nr:hypothetical protein [Paracoccaceae bacterium]
MPRLQTPKKTRFIPALVASAALALSGVATPARAGEIDPGAVVAGAITLGLLAAIVSNNKNDHKSAPPPNVYTVKPVTRTKPGHWQGQPLYGQNGYNQNGHYQNGHGQGWTNGHRAKAPKGQGWNVLPASCLRDVTRPGDTMTLYGQHCLAQAQVKVKDLPQVCAVKVPTRDGTYTGFDPSCMKARGYRVGMR